MPWAVNCSVAPEATLDDGAVTPIEERTGAVTVAADVPETAPIVAVIVAVPAETPVTSPPALTLATPPAFELQTT